MSGSQERPASSEKDQESRVPARPDNGIGIIMNEQIKTALLTVPIISLGGLLLGSSLEYRVVLGSDLVAVLFFAGAIILAIGLAILDVKRNSKEADTK